MEPPSIVPNFTLHTPNKAFCIMLCCCYADLEFQRLCFAISTLIKKILTAFAGASKRTQARLGGGRCLCAVCQRNYAASRLQQKECAGRAEAQRCPPKLHALRRPVARVACCCAGSRRALRPGLRILLTSSDFLRKIFGRIERIRPSVPQIRKSVGNPQLRCPERFIDLWRVSW